MLRTQIEETVRGITPFDGKEARDQESVLRWIDSGAPLFRDHGDVPPRHLAVYFALLDDERRTVLQVDHIKAGAWLFPGGHVDSEEPRLSVLREAGEELAVEAEFHPRFGDRPLFVTESVTRGPMSHTDVTLWFVLSGDQKMALTTDDSEFHAVRWAGLDDLETWIGDCHGQEQIRRFVAKLEA